MDGVKVTVPVPVLAPNPLPIIVTGVFVPPEVGERLIIIGAAETVKVTALLAVPLTVTITGPVVALVGTGATMEVPPQLVGLAVVPLKVTVLPPWVEPKLIPAIETTVLAGPDIGERVVIPGPPATVKLTPLLAIPPAVTTTFPLVAPDGTGTVIEPALQLEGVAQVPLKVTVLLPCTAPKLLPLIVIDSPIGPAAGDRPAIVGA
jgi:hypothetical protein